MIEIERAAGHLVGETAGIACFLAGKPCGAELFVSGVGDRFGSREIADLCFELAPDRRGGGDADLLVEDRAQLGGIAAVAQARFGIAGAGKRGGERSEEHTSELQSLM